MSVIKPKPEETVLELKPMAETMRAARDARSGKGKRFKTAAAAKAYLRECAK